MNLGGPLQEPGHFKFGPSVKESGGIAHNIFLISRLEERSIAPTEIAAARELAGDPDSRTGQSLAKVK